MRIVVGSKNEAKVGAVTEVFLEYPHLKDAVVVGLEAPSGVTDQPLSLAEVVEGARNRARLVFQDCEYSVGIESGFMKVPHSKSGYMNVCVACVYDGTQYHLGISSAFETPNQEIMRLVVDEGLNFAQAGNKTGMTHDPHIGKHGGLIGELTKGKVDRKEYTKQALRMALIHIDQHAF
jgi:inosine/xanthosine triphosphatase